jgi:Flp pilus assembly protein CpaB
MVGLAVDAPVPARVTRRAWRSRISAGHAVMVVAGLLGALGTMAALRAADHRVDVLVARNDLAPGTVVDASSFRTVRVSADARAMASFVRATEVTRIAGEVVTTRLPAGTFVYEADVRRAAAGVARRSMSFPIDRSRALDGQLVAGDRVDVVAVDARSGTARYVATDAEVLRVGGSGGHGPLAVSDTMTVTLAVDPDTALTLATALHGHDLTLVRATGAPRFSAATAKVAP